MARVYTDVLRVEDDSLVKPVKSGKKALRVLSEKKGDFFRREAEFNKVGSHIERLRSNIKKAQTSQLLTPERKS